MKDARHRLAARYVAALRAHLTQKGAGRGTRARRLGEAALAAGLVTLDLAIMHEQAVVALAASFDFAVVSVGALKRAGQFFTQALVPLEKHQRATRETNQQLLQRNETLRLHTAALARANVRLQREVTRRKAGELAVLTGKEEYRKLFLHSEITRKKLRRLTHQILTAQEEERKNISRELHDEVVQTLVGINVELSALGRGVATVAPAVQVKIARTQRLVETAVQAVHQFARELRPAVLDDLGLIPALHAYSKNIAERAKIKIQLTAFAGVEELASARRTVLFRVVQEALTNVARHARATRVDISLVAVPAAIRLEIADNGQSFPVKKILSAKTNRRLGLVGMRERVEMVGGSLTIDSAPGRGTTVRAEVPFNSKLKKSSS